MSNPCQWRHSEIADLLGRLTIKASGAFLEASPTWTCPSCGRSKAQIVAPGQNVDVVARIIRHHDHIENLIAEMLAGGAVMPQAARAQRFALQTDLERRFCRFQPVDICEACNNADANAKAIVQAPRWFSFSPHGIANFIVRPPEPYARKHQLDRYRLGLIWDKVLGEIEGLEARVARAIRDGLTEAESA